MKVVQLLLPGADLYDTKCHRADAGIDDGISAESWLLDASGRISSSVGGKDALGRLVARLRGKEYQLLHVYGASGVPKQLISSLPVPWVSSRPLHASRSFFSRPAPPARVLAAVVPEVVADEYFVETSQGEAERTSRVVASLARGRAIRRNWEQGFARIQRVRSDVEWRLLDRPPAPHELLTFDLWVDPASDENDFGGFVCEAMASGVPVVAGRTEINRARLDDGRAGVLVRPGDYNELAHSILGALFKDEVAAPRRIAAGEFRETFRVGARRHLLASLYKELG